MTSPIFPALAMMLIGSASWLRAGEPDERPFIHVEDYRTPIMSPLRGGGRLPECEAPPSEREILRAISGASQKGDEKSIDDVKISCERVLDKVEPPRSYPLVGTCALHHCRWKCTVYFTETPVNDVPVPAKTKKRRVQVVYIDRDHLHLVDADAKLPACVESDGLDMIPADTIAFASVRVRELSEKLDLARWASLVKECGKFEKNLGVAITKLERITIIATADSKDVVAMIRGSRPFKRDDVLKAADCKKVDLHGRDAYVGAKIGAICFVDERTILAANSEEMMAKFLEPRQGDFKKHLKRAAELAKTNDVAVWVDVSAVPELVMHLPKSVDSLHFAANVADNSINLELGVGCADRDGARWASKALQTGLKFARSASLMGTGVMDGAELFPTLADTEFRQQCRFVPLKLLRQTEKGLEKAQVHEDADSARLSIVIPIDQKSLRGEVAGIARLALIERSDSLLSLFRLQEWQAGMTLPSGRYLEHSPMYFPPEPPAPTPAPGPAEDTNNEASKTDKTEQKIELLPPEVVQTGAISSGGTSAKLAIANVRKETATLFTIGEGGKLTLVQKLPAGEAVDLKTTTGTRWLAVFTDKPAGESFSPRQGENTWLLRP
jgi:hypothetical protein